MSHLHQYFRIDVFLLPGATQRASLLKSPLDSGLNLSRAHPVLGFCCNLEHFDFPASLQNSQLLSFQRRFFTPHHDAIWHFTPHLFVSGGDVLDCIICTFSSILPMAAFQLSALASEGFLGFTSLFSQTQTHTSGQPDPSYLSACECQKHTHTHTPWTLLLFPRSSSPSLLCSSLSSLLAFPSLPSSASAPLYISLSLVSSSFSTSCVLHPVPSHAPSFKLPLFSLHISLSLRDVTFSTDIGAVASNLGQRDERTNTDTYRHMQI